MQRRQLHSDFDFRIFHLKDSKDKLILIVFGTLLQILGVIYETVSVPYVMENLIQKTWEQSIQKFINVYS